MQTLIVRLGSKDIEVVDLQTQLNVALKRITELEHFIKTATDPKSDQHKPGATA